MANSGHNTSTLYLGVGSGANPSMVSGYWNRDLDCVVLSACSVLDINDYNHNFSPGMGHEVSPGIQWEAVGPKILLGYNYKAPGDANGVTTAIINSWVVNQASGHEVDAWMNANAANLAWHACAIVKGEKYVYFEKWFGSRRKKVVLKENW